MENFYTKMKTAFFPPLMQALWRGYRERKTGAQEMAAVRERALSIIHNALPGTTLRTRSSAALFVLQQTCSGRLIWALLELGKLNLSGNERQLHDFVFCSCHYSFQVTQSWWLL
jgi:hypothetical protein